MSKYTVADTGAFNEIFAGYAGLACMYAGLTREQAEEVMKKMQTACDMYDASEAERVYFDGVPKRKELR